MHTYTHKAKLCNLRDEPVDPEDCLDGTAGTVFIIDPLLRAVVGAVFNVAEPAGGGGSVCFSDVAGYACGCRRGGEEFVGNKRAEELTQHEHSVLYVGMSISVKVDSTGGEAYGSPLSAVVMRAAAAPIPSDAMMPSAAPL